MSSYSPSPRHHLPNPILTTISKHSNWLSATTSSPAHILCRNSPSQAYFFSVTFMNHLGLRRHFHICHND